eukprot:UN00682
MPSSIIGYYCRANCIVTMSHNLYCTTQIFQHLYDKQQHIGFDERTYSVFICSACEYKYYTSIQTEPNKSTNQVLCMPKLNTYHQAVVFKKETFGTEKHQTNTSTTIEMKFCTQCGNKLKQKSETITPRRKYAMI